MEQTALDSGNLRTSTWKSGDHACTSCITRPSITRPKGARRTRASSSQHWVRCRAYRRPTCAAAETVRSPPRRLRPRLHVQGLRRPCAPRHSGLCHPLYVLSTGWVFRIPTDITACRGHCDGAAQIFLWLVSGAGFAFWDVSDETSPASACASSTTHAPSTSYFGGPWARPSGVARKGGNSAKLMQ